jgi:stage II sporulation protein D
MVAEAALLLVRVSVLGIFSPTVVTIEAGGQHHALSIENGALKVDAATQQNFRIAGDPLVTVAVIDKGRPRITRKFRGTIEARVSNGAILLVDELPDEEYLPGTVALESLSDHPEAQKAQAVVARTFVQRGARHAREGFDLCDLTHCQTYRGADGETEKARAAVAATRGEVLSFDGKIAEVYFTASCGGATNDVADVWPDGARRPYLRSVPCEACRRADQKWETTIALADLARAIDQPNARGVIITDGGAGGVVRNVRIEGAATTMTGEALRMTIGRALGWSRLRSDRFTVEKRGNDLHFRGSGAGHGVGLCETGAADLAKRGASYREILSRYFPGTTIDARRTGR